MGLNRYAKNRDKTEGPIVKALRAVGASVIFADHPDLIVGYRGQTFMLEVKSHRTKAGRMRLTASQEDLVATWQGGPLIFVTSPSEAMEAIGAIHTRVGSSGGSSRESHSLETRPIG